MKVLWQDRAFVMKCTLNALCLMLHDVLGMWTTLTKRLCLGCLHQKKMQLDVGVSPPANILSICLTLTKDLWPWPKWPLTLTSLPVRLQWDLKSQFLTWWPWSLTLTFNVDLWVIPGHALTKFHDPRYNTFCNMHYCPVNFCSVTDELTDSRTDGRADRQTDRRKAMHISCFGKGKPVEKVGK